MEKVRVGVIGLGIMGSVHADNLASGRVNRSELTAVCDEEVEKCSRFPKAKAFNNNAVLLKSGLVDAVIIATPHYSHTTIGIAALEQGLHVMTEKPISVHKADCERLLAAHRDPKQVFAVMFNIRTRPYLRRIHQLIRSGEVGEIRRINWTATNFFRTDAYYASGGWRATWAGEGGGVLFNQCPHFLDLWQWLFGMPEKVRGFCKIGRYHKIEVEDDVTAYFEYANGTTGVLVTSTGEAPGTNRLEIVAERGRIVVENDAVSYVRNEIPMSDFSRTSPKPFGGPPFWKVEIPAAAEAGNYVDMAQNFADAILDGTPLIAAAKEGINSVELANAIMMSSFQDKTITLPLNAAEYEKMLKKLIAESKRA